MTLLASSVFWVLGAGRANLTLVTGVMWCPGLAAIATKRLFSESPRELKWGWGSGRFQILAYLIPFVYAVPVYVTVWFTGLGGFYDRAFVDQAAKDYGLSGRSRSVALVIYILISLTA